MSGVSKDWTATATATLSERTATTQKDLKSTISMFGKSLETGHLTSPLLKLLPEIGHSKLIERLSYRGSRDIQSNKMVNNGTAYLLWLAFFFGLGGIQRFYLGKPISGVLYLCTWGFLGFGQLLDIVLIPSMVNEKNTKYRALYGSPHQAAVPQVVVNVGEGYPTISPVMTELPAANTATKRLDVSVLKICRDLGGATMSDCVIETEADPEEIKAIIHRLSVDGLLSVDNREPDGAIIYRAV